MGKVLAHGGVAQRLMIVVVLCAGISNNDILSSAAQPLLCIVRALAPLIMLPCPSSCSSRHCSSSQLSLVHPRQLYGCFSHCHHYCLVYTCPPVLLLMPLPLMLLLLLCSCFSHYCCYCLVYVHPLATDAAAAVVVTALGLHMPLPLLSHIRAPSLLLALHLPPFCF